jgi:hypothetical protein
MQFRQLDSSSTSSGLDIIATLNQFFLVGLEVEFAPDLRKAYV